MDELNDLEVCLRILEWNQQARNLLAASVLSVNAVKAAAAKAAAAKAKRAVLVSPPESSATAVPLDPAVHAATAVDAPAQALDSPAVAEHPALQDATLPATGMPEQDLPPAGQEAGVMAEMPQTGGSGALVCLASCADEAAAAGGTAHVVAPHLPGHAPEPDQEPGGVALRQEPSALEAAEPMQVVSDVQGDPLVAGRGDSLLALLTEGMPGCA